MGNTYRKTLLNAAVIDVEDQLICLAESQIQDENDGGLMEVEKYLVEDARSVGEYISQVVTASITNGLVGEHRETCFVCCQNSNVVLYKNCWVLFLLRLSRCRYRSWKVQNLFKKKSERVLH